MGFGKWLSSLCGAPGPRKPAWQCYENHPALEKFTPIKTLGKGSFSEIVLAEHIETKELVALKVIFLTNPQLYKNDETRELLIQESVLLLKLHHPNLVACREVIEGPKSLVLVLEYLKGGNVLDRLYALSHAYSERDAAAVFEQVAKALEYLHQENILHRDIKPENVMYAEVPVPGQPVPAVKLVDLGLAYIYDPKVIEKGVLGSAGFVAPEIVKGARHTPAMDVWSLGVLLFIMLVGRKPFNNSDNEALRYAYGKLQWAPGLKDPRYLELSPDAKSLLIGMLNFNPQRRLTMKQVLEHEWVQSKGGLVIRPLGQDVALAAAAVADLRRLRNLCGATVALRRVVQATVAERKSLEESTHHHTNGKRNSIDTTTIEDDDDDDLKSSLANSSAFYVAATNGGVSGVSDGGDYKNVDGNNNTTLPPSNTTNTSNNSSQIPVPEKLTAEHQHYLDQRKAADKAHTKGLTQRIAAKSFIKLHDSSTSIRRQSSLGNNYYRDSSNSLSRKTGGMRRSATAVMLSDLVVATDGHTPHEPYKIDRSVGGGKSFKRMTTFMASVVHLVDTSVRRGNGYAYAPSAEARQQDSSNMTTNGIGAGGSQTSFTTTEDKGNEKPSDASLSVTLL